MNLDRYLTNSKTLSLAQSKTYLDPNQASESFANRLTIDPAYPYWKFLQAACAHGSKAVTLELGRNDISLIARATRPYPAVTDLGAWTAQRSSVLAPLQQAALSLSQERTGNVTWQSDEPTPGEYRLRLFHRFHSGGGILSQAMRGMKHRFLVSSLLTTRASYYPIPLMEAGKPVQTPFIDGLSPTHERFPVGVVYDLTTSDDPDRFLSEPFIEGAYDNIFELVGSQAILRAQELPTKVYPRPSVLGFESASRERTGGIPLGKSAASLSLGSTSQCFSERLFSQRPAITGSNVEFCGFSKLCRESLFLPEQASGLGQIGLFDRGIFLGLVKVDLGIPGAVVLCGRRSLHIDLLHEALLENEDWSYLVSFQRHRTRQRARRFLQFLPQRSEGRNFLEAALTNSR